MGPGWGGLGGHFGLHSARPATGVLPPRADSDSDSDSGDSDDDKKDKTKPATKESSSEEEKEEKRLRLTFMGAMNVKAAIERLKSSYFPSIEKHGIVVGCKVHKDFVELKDKHTKATLPAWLNKMQVQYGIKHEELLNAYVEQLTGLRVIKMTDGASVMHNLINADTEDDVCRGFECFNTSQKSHNQ
eukprot:g2072.t1